LRLIVEGTVPETGTEFFRALVRNLAQALGTTGAWVTEYFPEKKRMNALAMWMNNGFIEHFEYSVAGTACADVVETGKLVHIPDRVIELYPRADDLIQLNAVSYLVAPLLDTDGSVIGNVGVLNNKPMPKDPRAISLLKSLRRGQPRNNAV
jgi:GAF domain